MVTKKVVIVTIALLTVVGSAAALFYIWHDLPKKTPMRAKQVFYFDTTILEYQFTSTLKV